jgi:transcription elongation GreA/GreB family factor
MDYSELKNILYQKCLDWLDNKIAITTKAMNDAQESANSEEKSSAGDKYETGRAMSQNERDMYARQLAECIKQKQVLLNIDLTKKHDRVSSGALVITESAIYFVSISAGIISIDNKSYFAISPDTPIAQLMLNKKQGEEFAFNNKKAIIKEVW